MLSYQSKLFIAKFLKLISVIPEYTPRMEVLAVSLDYDNQTATLSVSVYVGIPITNENINRPSSNVFDKSVSIENFTSYEIYLTAALQEDTSLEPPLSCFSDIFLQHSHREVIVECPVLNGNIESELSTNSQAHPSWETVFVDPNAVNIY